MKRVAMFGVLIAVAVLLWAFAGGGASAATETERNKAFTESMSGVTLVGYSTRTNREGLSKEERYTIDSVTHVAGDNWLFKTRMQYGGREMPFPIPLTVKWAGDDTPVITLTDMSVPGMGTYTARVVLYGEQYAGLWSAGKSGGQMFGKIVKNAPAAAKPPAESESPTPTPSNPTPGTTK